MIRILNNADAPSPVTTLNDIPQGTVFYGEVQRNDMTWAPRLLYLKTQDHDGRPYTCALEPGLGIERGSPAHGVWTKCRSVRAYQPVDIDIRVRAIEKGGA